MESQTQQPTEDGGSNTAAGSSANMLCRRSSTRWTPTTDQIRILNELFYNKGVRSPTIEQVQRITLQLKRYGKIEGKNIFYWFHNHKAREKQKKKFTSDVPVPMQRSGLVGKGSIDLNFGSGVCCSVDPYFSSSFTTSTSTTFFGMNEKQTFMEQRGEDHQEIETLPLFPMHGEDILGNMKTTSDGGGGYGGGSRISLELSLNSSGAADVAKN